VRFHLPCAPTRSTLNIIRSCGLFEGKGVFHLPCAPTSSTLNIIWSRGLFEGKGVFHLPCAPTSSTPPACALRGQRAPVAAHPQLGRRAVSLFGRRRLVVFSRPLGLALVRRSGARLPRRAPSRRPAAGARARASVAAGARASVRLPRARARRLRLHSQRAPQAPYGRPARRQQQPWAGAVSFPPPVLIPKQLGLECSTLLSILFTYPKN
jgi:hypothetical protein